LRQVTLACLVLSCRFEMNLVCERRVARSSHEP
jgi:hypothetical protein